MDCDKLSVPTKLLVTSIAYTFVKNMEFRDIFIIKKNLVTSVKTI